MRGSGRETALSDALGAIFLVAVVGMAIAIAGVAILSQPPPEKIPTLNADITTVGKLVMISHNGGDSLAKSDMAIIIDGADKTGEFLKPDGTQWSAWAVGDTLVYDFSNDPSVPQGITIFYIGRTSSTIIQSLGIPQSVSAGGLYLPPTPSIVATPTPVPGDPVSAGFSASPVTGLAPLSVQFYDESTGLVTTWLWSFGDSSTSALPEPVHQYMAAGTYSVGLTVGNGTGTNALTKTDYITVTQYAPGLLANYFNDQAWSDPAITKTATRVRFADSSSGDESDVLNWPVDYIGSADDFSVSFDGFLLVPTEADYTFYLTSDDGSYMVLDGTEIIDNRGLHSATEETATVHLTPGFHPIQVRMMENTGQAVAHLEYNTTTISRTFVTDLYHTPNTAPFSDFTGTPRVGSAPLTVQFTDTSVDASSWTWNFGDGSDVSHAKNPQHTYATGGSYTVTLTTTNAIGSNTASKPDYIVMETLDPGLGASYYYGQTWTNLAGTRVDNRIWFADPAGVTRGYATDEVGWPSAMVGRQDNFSVSWDGFVYVPAGEVYTFYLTSDDASFLWIDDVMVIDNGGDHSAREYTGTVSLTTGHHGIRVRMSENGGEAVAHLEYSTPTIARTPVTDVWHIPITPVTPAPVAGFAGTPTTGSAPLTVVFTDTSTGSPTSWTWDFGDGDSTNATARNPVHRYVTAGTYSVSLTAINAGGSNTATRTNYIVVSPAPVTAVFTGAPTSGIRPLAVQFTDASTGPVVSRSWTFGDGNTSTVTSPLYTYPDAGTYSVSLTVSNGTGTHTLTRTGYITTTSPAPVKAVFTGTPTSGILPLAVQFTDASTGPVVSRSWTFGDGNTSTVTSPLYTYPDAGTYSVSLTVSNGTGTHTLTRANYIVTTYPAPTVTSITPSNGPRDSSVAITDLAGTNFRTGATVTFVKDSHTVSGTGVTVVSSNKITCTFPIPKQPWAAGNWDVIVTNTDTKTGTLTGGFLAT